MIRRTRPGWATRLFENMFIPIQLHPAERLLTGLLIVSLVVVCSGFGIAGTETRAQSAVNGIPCTNLTFLDAPRYPTQIAPKDLATADFDGDGLPDVALASAFVMVSVHRNTGSGLGPRLDFPTASLPQVLLTADFDGDGKLDIAVGHFNVVTILRNTSTGPGVITFVQQGVGGVGPQVEAIFAADLDGDSKQDLVTSNRQGGNVSVLQNVSTGAGSVSFAPAVNFAVGSQPWDVRAMDLDGDGKLDLGAVLSGSVLAVLRNTTVGDAISFAPKVDFSTGSISQPRSMATADFDGDGRVDVAYTRSGGIGILRNTSSGAGILSFAAPMTLTTNQPIPLVADDFDADGKTDLIGGLYGTNNVVVLENVSPQAGTITFAERKHFGSGTGPYSMAIADFNADGRPDLATANNLSDSISILRNTSVPLQEISFFARRQTLYPMPNVPNSYINLDLHDMDGDGFDDLVILDSTRQEVSIRRNDGSGNFPSVFQILAIGTADGFALADYDGDGKTDIAVFGSPPNSVSVYRNTSSPGTDNFTFATSALFANAVRHGRAGDFSGDGKIDLAMASVGANIVSVMVNTSSGPGNITFATGVDTAVAFNPLRLLADDFDVDGKLDLAVGIDDTSVYMMRNTTASPGVVSFSSSLLFQGIDFKDFASGDHDGDGRPDLTLVLSSTFNTTIRRNTSQVGQITFETVSTFPSGPTTRRVRSIDIDLDGDPDTIIGNGDGGSGSRPGFSILKNISTGPGSPAFDLTSDLPASGSPEFAITDFNKDGYPDILLAGLGFLDYLISTCAGVQRTTVFDFDGDGKTDIGIFRPSVGEWWYQRSSDGQVPAFQFGAGTDRIVPADYTGDGKTDIAFFRPSTGEWYILRSEDLSFYSFPFGASEDIPAPSDYDADGKADPAVFRPSTATWFIQRSSDNGTTIAQFGATGDHPVAADYDGDGKADLAIYRPSNGQWWLNRSTAGVIVHQFGNETDKTVPGDYTGDGKADVAFWRPSTGEWYILRSEDNSYYSAPFGTSTDIPAPGDYDGDGKFDTTVFRPSEANWYVQRSTAGTLIQQFGASGDMPIPNAFVR